MAVKIILDTDIGGDIDDALAVAFMVRRPELDVKAITTVCGRTDLRTRLLAKLLGILGRDDIPIASGRRYPLGPVGAVARQRLEEHVPCQCAFVEEDEAVREPACDSAEEIILHAVEEHAGDVGLVAIGPLTNIGAIIQEHPGLLKKINFINMMGGAYALNHAEYNVACDPEAASIVLRAECEKFLGTFEVTRRVMMREPEMRRLRQSGTDLADALDALITLWMPRRGAKPGPVLYDICPLIWCFDRGFFETERTCIDVITNAGDRRGYTVRAEGIAPTEVTVDMRAEDALELFMDTICRG